MNALRRNFPLALIWVAIAGLTTLALQQLHADPPTPVYSLLHGKRIGVALSGEPERRHRVFIGLDRIPGNSEAALVEHAGGRVHHRYHLVPAMAAELSEAGIDALLQRPQVLSIEGDGLVSTADSELDNSWGVAHIGAGSVHSGGNRGEAVKIAVIDTGIDNRHADLARRAGGYDFVNRDKRPDDDHSHGTHIAGIIAALDNDDNASVVGAAPAARLYALKALDASGSGYWSDIVAAVQWAVDNGMAISNNSYTASGHPGSTVEAAFNAADSAGLLQVAAAGNSGNASGSGDSVGYPARFASVIAVASTGPSDLRAANSSTGPAVELAAPGVAVYSTLPGGSFGEKSGTSMAAPHVAGVAALVLAAGIDDSNGNGRRNDELRQRLQNSASDLGASGRDSHYGYGLVDAVAATAATLNTPPQVSITTPADGASFASGASIEFSASASDAEEGDLSENISWHSDLDSDLGNGAVISATLSDGEHLVSAEVSDSANTSDSDSISVRVGTGGEAPIVSVTQIRYSNQGGRDGNKHLQLALELRDNNNWAVASTQVSVEVYFDGDNCPQPMSGNFWGASTGITDTEGNAVFRLKNTTPGYYTTVVTAVDALGWDNITPANCHP